VSLSEPPLALRWALPWVKHLVMRSVQRLVPQSGRLMELQMAPQSVSMLVKPLALHSEPPSELQLA